MTRDPLTGRVALVTGGSSGIGLAIARALIAEGMKVGVTGRDDKRLSAARQQLESAGPGAVETFRADVRRYDEVERSISTLVSRHGGLDVVVNNAGVGIFADVGNMEPEQWATVIDTNLTGTYHVCHAAIPRLRSRGGGFIINISSLAGKNAFKGGAAYCASKPALNAFSEALMQEVRYDNIRVSYVMPGSVATAFSGGDESQGDDWKILPEDVAETVLDLLRTPARTLSSRIEMRPSKPRK
jgi:NADP-dependent 3-hydroxy acid dehydrogenase YdfG